MLQSNIAACHIKLEEWSEAIDSASKSVDALERIDPLPKRKTDHGQTDSKKSSQQQQTSGVIEEIDDETAAKIEALEKSGKTKDDVQKIRVKAFLRRAKARSETGGWAALQGAYEGMFNSPSVPVCTSLIAARLQLSQHRTTSIAP